MSVNNLMVLKTNNNLPNPLHILNIKLITYCSKCLPLYLTLIKIAVRKLIECEYNKRKDSREFFWCDCRFSKEFNKGFLYIESILLKKKN